MKYLMLEMAHLSLKFDNNRFDSFTPPYLYTERRLDSILLPALSKLCNGLVLTEMPVTRVSYDENHQKIVFDKPAACWEETLPLGNGRLGNNSFATWIDNTYWDADGQIDQGNYDTGTVLTTDPAFVDPENGIFTPTGADQVAKQTGDPRWYYVIPLY